MKHSDSPWVGISFSIWVSYLHDEDRATAGRKGRILIASSISGPLRDCRAQHPALVLDDRYSSLCRHHRGYGTLCVSSDFQYIVHKKLMWSRLLNVISVRWFGIAEFYLSIFKVVLICGCIAFTFVTMVGGNPLHDRYGFRYWKNPVSTSDSFSVNSIDINVVRVHSSSMVQMVTLEDSLVS